MADFPENEFLDEDEDDEFSFLRLTKMTIFLHSLETGEDSSELIADIDAVIDGDADLSPELLSRITDFLDEGDGVSDSDDEEDSSSCFDYETKPPVLTFNEHRIETAGHFTFEVPDNWIVKKDFDDFGTFRPILISEKDFSDEAELGLTNHIVYSTPPVDLNLDAMAQYDIRWAINFTTAYSMSLPFCYCDWDTQVEAQNTRCFVHRKMGAGANSVTYQINPYLSNAADGLLIIAHYESEDDLNQIEEAVLYIASTLVVDDPPADMLAALLERSKTEVIELADFARELANMVLIYQSFAGKIIESAINKYRNINPEMNQDDCAVFAAKSLREFYRDFATHINMLIDIQVNQKKLGCGSRLDAAIAPMLNKAIANYPSPSVFGEEFSEVVQNSEALDPDGEIDLLRYRLKSVFGDYADLELSDIL